MQICKSSRKKRQTTTVNIAFDDKMQESINKCDLSRKGNRTTLQSVKN